MKITEPNSYLHAIFPRSLRNGLPPVPRFGINDEIANQLRRHHDAVAVALDGVLETGAPLDELAISHDASTTIEPGAPLDNVWTTSIWRGQRVVARVRMVYGGPLFGRLQR